MNELRRRRSRARRWFGRALLLLCGVAVPLLLAEVAFRALHLFHTRPRTWVGEFANAESKNFAPDPVLGWRVRPGHRFTNDEGGREVLYVADENGFRIDPARPPPADPRRLVAVGDSFTFGAGVAAADTWPAVLADLLGGLSLTNAAQPGYGLDQVWQALLHEAIPRAPDLIVVGVYPEDFERNHYAYRKFERLNKPTFKLEDGRLVPLTAADRANPVVGFLESHSRTFALAQYLAITGSLRFGVGGTWRLGEAMLDDMARAGRDARVPVVFVNIPPETLEPFPALAGHMKKTGAPFVDPLEALKRRGGRLYLERNGHLNEAGHRVVAEEIAAFLRNRGDLLGPSTRRHIESRPNR